MIDRTETLTPLAKRVCWDAETVITFFRRNPGRGRLIGDPPHSVRFHFSDAEEEQFKAMQAKTDEILTKLS